MLFTEPTFLFVFLPVLLVLYYAGAFRLKPEAPTETGVTPASRWKINYRNWLLVVASVIFYARGEGSFTGFIVASIAVNYLAALGIDRVRDRPSARIILGATVALNLAALAGFKYAGFLATNLNALITAAGFAGIPVPSVLLPIGISFFTFHSISYIVDVYRREAVAQKRPVEAALYLLLFPQLVAGPIIRYREIADQLSARLHRAGEFAEGVRRFIVGLAKKMLIANVVAVPADRIFAMPPGELTAAHAWLAVSCYTLQIYFDFSGYSDMAIGLGRMFGFRFPENFNYPYVAASVQEFWRRWHITLSAWFRDYLYVPLGGNRAARARVYVNLLTVFFLCGLWHGANWTFVVWGLLHGSFLIAERVGLARLLDRLPPPGRHVYVLAVVMVGWVFFRADSLAGGMTMLGALVGRGAGIPTIYPAAWYLTPELLLAMVAGVIGSTPVARWFGQRGDASATHWRPLVAHAVLLVMFALSIMLSAARTYNPFIYFQF